MPAVILDRHARTECRFAESADLDEAHDALALASPGREQLEHAVVVDRFADQGPPDDSGQVVVTHARRVGVTVRSLRRLRGRPHSDPDYRPQATRNFDTTSAEGQSALEGIRDGRDPHDGR